MRVFIFAIFYLAAVSAKPSLNVLNQRIVGGSEITIDNYPTIVGVLQTTDGVNLRHICGGTTLNQRTVLTAAHCMSNIPQYRIRVGSSMAHSGGILHNVQRIIPHPDYNEMLNGFDSDIGVMHTASFIVYNNLVQPGTISGPNYNIPDNDVVWAAGWGLTSEGGQMSEHLRHVQMRYINDALCRTTPIAWSLTNNMLCAGLLGIGGASQCQGDSGGPLYHQGTVVGVCSFGGYCGAPNSPSVNVRVSRFVTWIENNAFS